MFGSFFDLFRHRGEAKSQKAVFDIDQFGDMCNRSLVVKISVIVIIWAFCAMILTLSLNSQKDISNWEVGKTATRLIVSKAAFEYDDVDKKEEMKSEARKKTPDFFDVRDDLTRQMKAEMKEFFERIDLKSKGALLPGASAIAGKVDSASPELIETVVRRRSDGTTPSEWTRFADKKLYDGIIGTADKASRLSGKEIKIVNGDGKIISRSIADCPNVAEFANGAADIWGFEKESASRDEFVKLFSAALGDKGNLVFNGEKTGNAHDRACKEIDAMVLKAVFPAGEKIVKKGDAITPGLYSKLESYRKKFPAEFKIMLRDGAYNLCRSLMILAVVIFYLVSLKSAIMKDTKGIVVIGSIIIISLIVNYWTLRFFEYLSNEGHLKMQELIAMGIPVELPMVLLVVLLGFRPALATGFLVISISVMMLSPDHYNQFQQALRWLVVGGISSLCVVKVVNYRTFWVRVFCVSALVKLLVYADWDLVSRVGEVIGAGNAGSDIVRSNLNIITQDISVAAGSSFVSAVLALVLIFIFEIVFNLDTNMALTVLGNFNHKLLEEMRRKAQGTMNHSLTVSTLAEDAAKAIGANSLRAKVAALFHDIGKIENPEYFTENNPDSAALYEGKSPQLSSMVIRGHVKNGLALARQHHLFRYIREAIGTHHGDDLVRFFYEKAKEECRQKGAPESSVREADFRYTGTPPRDKELVIVSLADACEAASRSLKDPSETRIEKLVDDIIVGRLLGGQLRNGILTLEELCVIRDSFVKTLLGIYHGRIAYPDNKKR